MIREISRYEHQRFCLCGALIGYFPEDTITEWTEWIPAVFDPEDYSSYEVRYKQEYIICPCCGTKMVIDSIQEVRSK